MSGLNSNQNMGNFRGVSKIHNPPGGRTTLNLFGGDDAPPARKPQPAAQSAPAAQAAQPAAGGSHTSVRVSQPSGGTTHNIFGGGQDTDPAPVRGKAHSNPNPTQPAAGPAPGQLHTSVRVHAPAGGASQIQFG